MRTRGRLLRIVSVVPMFMSAITIFFSWKVAAVLLFWTLIIRVAALEFDLEDLEKRGRS